MIQKLFYSAAAAVAAFALVLFGGVLAQIHPASASQGQAAVIAQAAAQSAAYQQQIQQANTQLTQAYQQQQTLQQQLSQAKQQLADAQQQLAQAQQQLATAPQGNTQATTTFTADQATSLVLNVGTLYLDASSGQVLAAVPASQRGSAPAQGETGGDDN
jgi:septal ring factor EnvC (AmiA/AmiB activator)